MPSYTVCLSLMWKWDPAHKTGYYPRVRDRCWELPTTPASSCEEITAYTLMPAAVLSCLRFKNKYSWFFTILHILKTGNLQSLSTESGEMISKCSFPYQANSRYSLNVPLFLPVLFHMVPHFSVSIYNSSFIVYILVIRSKRREHFEKKRMNAAQNLIKAVRAEDPAHTAEAGPWKEKGSAETQGARARGGTAAGGQAAENVGLWLPPGDPCAAAPDMEAESRIHLM